MATMLKVGKGPEEFSVPENASLEYLQGLVGGLIEFITFHDGSALMVNEEGLIKRMEQNDSACALCFVKRRHLIFPIVGDAVFFSRAEMEALESENEDKEEP